MVEATKLFGGIALTMVIALAFLLTITETTVLYNTSLNPDIQENFDALQSNWTGYSSSTTEWVGNSSQVDPSQSTDSGFSITKIIGSTWRFLKSSYTVVIKIPPKVFSTLNIPPLFYELLVVLMGIVIIILFVSIIKGVKF